MITLEDIMKTMRESVKGIADAVYEGDRPLAVANKTNTFIVVDAPGFINNKEMDESGSYGYFTTAVDFYVFVRDKITSEKVGIWNRPKLSELTENLFQKFPIIDKDRGIRIGSPRVIYSAADGHDFHYTTIQANLTTYF